MVLRTCSNKSCMSTNNASFKLRVSHNTFMQSTLRWLAKVKSTRMMPHAMLTSST